MLDAYIRKKEHISRQAYPVIRKVYETKSHQYKNIVVPFTDGKRLYQVSDQPRESIQQQGERGCQIVREQIMLATIDEAWKEQFREMDDLRQSVQNAAYEQKDPC
jgi:preprotein translocase subunit SecA